MPDQKSDARPDWESTRAKITVPKGQVPPPTADGVHWDQPALDGPPAPQKREIPKLLEPIVRFFQGIVMDEGLLVDLCIEHAMALVDRNIKSKLFGIDLFTTDGQGGSGYTAVHTASIAAPIAVELYKQTLKAIEGRKEEYEKLVEEMSRAREAASSGGARIVLPE